MSFTFNNTVSRSQGGSSSINLPGTGDTRLGPAPEFGGKGDEITPEHMFVGSVNGCLMQTFMYFAKDRNITISSYRSDATGLVEKGPEGFCFTRVEVRAEVVVPGTQDPEEVCEAGNLAEKYCLVSSSLDCPVEYTLSVKTQESSK